MALTADRGLAYAGFSAAIHGVVPGMTPSRPKNNFLYHHQSLITESYGSQSMDHTYNLRYFARA